MPALLSTVALEALQRKTAGATKERMLRELAEAVELITAERPLALVLEDLHWGDHSTLDWLAFMARRQERARLLVLGTYRPMEMLANGHPLRTVKQELQLHRQCVEQRLGLLSQEHVASYLAVKFSPEGDARRAVSLHKLAHVIHQRTEGNPLFMVNVVEYLAAQGGRGETVETVQRGVPGDLRQMIEEQIHRLRAEEQQLLEVASVAGMEFSAAAVAAGAEIEVEAIEELCTQLARREFFLRPSGTTEWPDGTVAARYSFLHSLYQEVLYERLPAGRRQRLHQRIGEREEQGYGERAREIAAELAMHFERGRDYRKTVQYLQHAGENALRRSAHQEASSLLTKGLEVLQTLPDTPERAQKELTLQLSLGAVLAATKGFAAREAKLVYARARALCQQVEEPPEFFPVLLGLWGGHYMRGELSMARELSEQLLILAQRGQDPTHLLLAHSMLGETLLSLGEVASAQAHAEQSLAHYNPQSSRFSASWSNLEPGIYALSIAALAWWDRGYPDRAVERIQRALAGARELAHPFSSVIVLACAASLHAYRQEWPEAQAEAEALLALANERGFAQRVTQGMLLRGGALVGQGEVEEGMAQIRQGLTAYWATGRGVGVAYFLALLAAAYGQVGQAEEGLALIAEALAVVDKTGERHWEAELYRIKGELIFQSSVQRLGSRVQENRKSKIKTRKSKIASPQSLTPSTQDAEACFLKAVDIARKQQAKSWELRAVISLSRLWQQQGKKVESHEMLSEIYNWFTEGFDTKDLQEAKVLLAELT
jgi:predicted ATPase